jgi:hypothetical protein
MAVLNILTEHDFRGAFKNGSRAADGAYTRKGTTSMEMTSGAKVSF